MKLELFVLFVPIVAFVAFVILKFITKIGVLFFEELLKVVALDLLMIVEFTFVELDAVDGKNAENAPKPIELPLPGLFGLVSVYSFLSYL